MNIDIHDFKADALLRRLPPRAREMAMLAASLLLAAVALRPAGIRLGEFMRSQSAANYYFGYNYSGEGLIWLVVAAAVGAGALAGYFRENELQGRGILLAALVVGVLASIAQPIAFHRRQPQKDSNFAADVGALRDGIDHWRAKHGHLPFTKPEIADAVSINGRPTSILKAGRRYEYHFIVAGVSDDYIHHPPVGAEPGEIYYTLSSAEDSYSLGVVSIGGNVSELLAMHPEVSQSGLGKR